MRASGARLRCAELVASAPAMKGASATAADRAAAATYGSGRICDIVNLRHAEPKSGDPDRTGRAACAISKQRNVDLSSRSRAALLFFDVDQIKRSECRGCPIHVVGERVSSQSR